MALFLSEADLLARIRATEIASGTDAYAIVQDAISRARVKIYTRLGATRVSEILSYAYSATPSTDEEILRTLAANVEVAITDLWVQLRLPTALMDASGDLNKRWNEEAPFRERDLTKDEIAQIEAQIEEDLAILAGDRDADCGLKVFVSGDRTTNPRPNMGFTLKGSRFYGVFKRGPWSNGSCR